MHVSQSRVLLVVLKVDNGCIVVVSHSPPTTHASQEGTPCHLLGHVLTATTATHVPLHGRALPLHGHMYVP